MDDNFVADQDFGANLITLVDDEGKEHEFEILDEVDHDDSVFYALMPTSENPEEAVADVGTYYIFEVIEEDGEEMLAEVEDDALLSELENIFEDRFKSLYDEEDEDEEDEEK